jgi:hypothetical protein
MISTTRPSPTARPATHRVARRSSVIAVATIAALLFWAIADRLAGIDLIVHTGGGEQQVGAGAVAATSVLAGLAAVGLAALLNRRTSRPRRTWLVVATTALVVSLAGPLGATTIAAGLALAALHVVVGATLILGIAGTLPEQRSEASR